MGPKLSSSGFTRGVGDACDQQYRLGDIPAQRRATDRDAVWNLPGIVCLRTVRGAVGYCARFVTGQLVQDPFCLPDARQYCRPVLGSGRIDLGDAVIRSVLSASERFLLGAGRLQAAVCQRAFSGSGHAFGATIPALLNTLHSGAVAKGRDAARSPGYLLYIASLAIAAGVLLLFLVLHKRMDYGDLLLVAALLSCASLVVISLFDARSKISYMRIPLLSLAIVVSLAALLFNCRLAWNEELLFQGHNFGIAQMPNVSLLHDDAIHAVRLSEGGYSLILNTVTSPLFFSSSKLYTVEFLQGVRSKLAPGGL